MDIRLKGDMDGVEAAEQIRARFHIPVIYLTAYADEMTVQRAKITEPFGYILKPFQTRELQTTIEIALYKHEMEQELKAAHVKLARQVKELEGRDRLVQFQMSGPSLKEAWSDILHVLEEVLGVQRAIIYWPGATGDQLEAVAVLGLSRPEAATLSPGEDEGLAAQAFQEARPCSSPAGDEAAVPILYRDKVMGVIWVGGPEEDGEALNTLWRLGQQAALLLRMARVTEEQECGIIQVDELLELEEEGVDGA